jgi:hypothetical protein
MGSKKLKTLKKLLEIQPGLHYKQFCGLFDFTNFEELKEIVTNSKYSDWKKTLSIS